MDPVKLELRNFSSYREAVVDLSPLRLAVVVGPNGAGKSSLLDAITWALFGEGTKGGKKELDSYVTRGQSECRVGVEFVLGGETYKVVRTRNIAKNKSTLDLFVMQNGNWQPLSGKSAAETQAVIERLLRMDFRTFVSTSLILQGQADVFTRDMTDAERKDVMARILGLDLWDRLAERVKEEARALRERASALSTQERAMAEKADAIRELKESLAQKTKEAKEAERAREKAQEEAASLEASAAKRELLERRLKEIEDQKASAERDATASAAEVRRIDAESEGLKEILERASEIRRAVEEARELEEAVGHFDEQAEEFRRLSAEIEKLSSLAAAAEQKRVRAIGALEAEKKAKAKQAALLETVPCGQDLKAKCRLLSEARDAAARLEAIEEELARVASAVPREAEKIEELRRRRDALGYDQNEHSAARALLSEVRKTASLLPKLEAAEARLSSLKVMREKAEELEAKAKKTAEDLSAEADNIRRELLALPSAEDLASAKERLSRALAVESAVRTEIGRLQQALEEAERAEEALEGLREELKKAKEEEETLSILETAAGKKAGVPALIFEAAVPEVEKSANQILSKVADGRLQIRIVTQADTKAGTVQEVFKVAVLDAGYERPYQTFSGAERFLVDLALRIGLSKFLARRCGAEIGLLVLDEGLGCADAANRHAVVEVLSAVSREFKKVLVVTHIDELKDAFPQRVEVNRTAAGSEVRIR